jgi:hypothetical protein
MSAGGQYRLNGPQLSVVRTDFRPKDVRLHLDGRFVGRARYFNGKQGYLFLEPGRYRLEFQFGGYRTEVFQIDAQPGCRFDIKHRMERQGGSRKEEKGDRPGKGVPSQRVFGPIDAAPEPERPGRRGGPDPSLRRDLGAESTEKPPPRSTNASLRLKVLPTAATVQLDGVFLATGSELDMMVEPVAITAGDHILEVMAPGFATKKVSFHVGRGEVEEVQVVLQRSAAR